MSDHLTRAASCLLATATLFVAGTALAGAVAARGANIEQLPPRDSARALEALTVAQSQGGDGSCFGASATSARSKDPRPATSGKTRFAREYASATPAGTARTTAPATNLLERETHRLPTDPFQRVAVRALRGDWGPLPDWKRCAYEWGLVRGVEVCGVAKVTSYGYLWEPAWLAGGTTCASGARVYVGECAANPEIPFGTIIWTAAYGLARVEDRGGWVKVGYARVHGRMKRVTNRRETANFDYYSEEPWPTRRNCPWARVKH